VSRPVWQIRDLLMLTPIQLCRFWTKAIRMIIIRTSRFDASNNWFMISTEAHTSRAFVIRPTQHIGLCIYSHFLGIDILYSVLIFIAKSTLCRHLLVSICLLSNYQNKTRQHIEQCSKFATQLIPVTQWGSIFKLDATISKHALPLYI
jgi:hypothetical protein